METDIQFSSLWEVNGLLLKDGCARVTCSKWPGKTVDIRYTLNIDITGKRCLIGKHLWDILCTSCNWNIDYVVSYCYDFKTARFIKFQ